MIAEKRLTDRSPYGPITCVSRPGLNAPGQHTGVQIRDGLVAVNFAGTNMQVGTFKKYQSVALSNSGQPYLRTRDLN